MTAFKFVISDIETRKSYQVEVDKGKAIGLVGKKIGDQFEGSIIGLPDYSLQITGGTDKDGFPMHPSVTGPGRKKVLLSSTPGYHPKIRGQRKRKMVRGNTLSEDIVQVNCKVVKKGAKPLEETFGKKEKPAEEVKIEEKPKEEKQEVKEKPVKKEEVKSEQKKEGGGENK